MRLLNNEEEREIVQLCMIGVRAGVIAIAYGVSRQTISRLNGNDKNISLPQLQRSTSVKFSREELDRGISRLVNSLGLK